ncbi:MAG: hypothetical protein E7626_07030 [Ruminococcaceae bacterium]|nr:hypothetical protein [Oscillospiraceae bacterium]
MKRHFSTLLSVLLVAVMILAMVPAAVSAAATKVATFEFGADGATGHADGSDVGTSKSYTEGGYTLALTGASKVFSGAKDETGKSCLKLGTSSTVGTFSFIVANDVTQVIIYVAKYKAKDTTIDINGTQTVISTSSNDGSYTPVTVDTTTNKTVTFATVSGKCRCMINTIEFYTGTASGGTTPTPPPTPTYVSITEALAATDGANIYTEGVITFIDGGNVFIHDGTAGICAYFNPADSTLAVGDKIKVSGSRDEYKGLPEVASATVEENSSSNNSISYTTTTLAALAADTSKSLLLKPVKITGVQVSDISGTTVTVTDGTNSMQIYKCPELTGIDAGDTININKAVIGIYNNYQIRVNSASDIEFVADGSVAAPTYVSISEARAANSGDIVYTEGVIILIDGSNLYIYDGTAGICARLSAADSTLAVGDKVKVKGTRGAYNGLEQLNPTSIEEKGTSNNAITYSASTIAAILADVSTGALESTPVKLENVVIGEINTSGNTAVTDANGNTINIYKIPALTGIEEGDTVTINAVVSDYNGYQLRVASASDITLATGGNQGGNQGGGSASTGDATAIALIVAAVATVTLAGVYFTKKRTLAD